jgi:hypothetical protein
VAGERQLPLQREDPIAVVGLAVGRRLHERRLREARLACDGEHRRVAEIVGAVDHAQAVAGQRRRREDVQPRDRVTDRTHF